MSIHPLLRSPVVLGLLALGTACSGTTAAPVIESPRAESPASPSSSSSTASPSRAAARQAPTTYFDAAVAYRDAACACKTFDCALDASSKFAHLPEFERRPWDDAENYAAADFMALAKACITKLSLESIPPSVTGVP